MSRKPNEQDRRATATPPAPPAMTYPPVSSGSKRPPSVALPVLPDGRHSASPSAGSPVVVLPRVGAQRKGSIGSFPSSSGGRHPKIQVLRNVSGDPPEKLQSGGGQLVLSTRRNTAASDTDSLTAHHEFAVVPFLPSPHSDTVERDGGRGRGLLTVVDSNQWALSTRRVCPTCLRPYDDPLDEEPLSSGRDDAEEGTGSGGDGAAAATSTRSRRGRSHSLHGQQHASPPRSVRRFLSPQYFRALEPSQPLAISDGVSDKRPPTTAPPSPSPLQDGRQRRLSLAKAPPALAYTPGGHPHHRGSRGAVMEEERASPDAEWAGEEEMGPPRIMSTIPYATYRADGDRGNEEEEVEEREGPVAGRASASGEPEASKEQEARTETDAARAPAGSPPPPQLSSNGYYARYFVEVQKLGSGTYGGVYLCQHMMEGVSLGTFALKKIPVGDNAAYLQKVLSEVRILEEVKRHPNVVEYNHSWAEEAQLADFGPPVRCLFILMEYATEGSLDSYLDRYGTALSTVAVWYFFLSAVAGTAHLHQKQILHRDLKPQNLLLTGPPGVPPRVLVSDFGTAAILGESTYERTGGTGTVEYMAPELMEVMPHVDQEHYVNRHTKASDVWSLGMILYYLACDATLPPRLADGSSVIDVPAHSPFARPPEMIELIRAMLQRDPKRRPSCAEILSSTVVQTILRSFNSAASSGGVGAESISRDVAPRDGSETPPSPEQPPIFRRRRTLAQGAEAEDPRVPIDGRSSGGNHADDGISVDYGSTPPPHEDSYGYLQSSRVELLSTTVGNTSLQTLGEAPLLMQYRSADATSNKLGASRPDLFAASPPGSASPLGPMSPNSRRPRGPLSVASPTAPPPREPSPETVAPRAKRARLVDAAAQTDPVHFAD